MNSLSLSGLTVLQCPLSAPSLLAHANRDPRSESAGGSPTTWAPMGLSVGRDVTGENKQRKRGSVQRWTLGDYPPELTKTPTSASHDAVSPSPHVAGRLFFPPSAELSPGQPRRAMSDLDSLVLSFQSRLQDVMEAVLQVAVFQVTKLVQDVFLVEAKRRGEELEALRTELQQQAGRREDQGGGDPDPGEGGTADPRDDAWSGWKSGCRREGKSGSPGDPAAARSPGQEAQATEEEDLTPDVKEEELNTPSCSAEHVRRWSGAPVDDAGPESEPPNEAAEAQSKEADENNEELLQVDIKPDLQISAAFPFPEDQPEPHVTASLEVDSTWPGRPATAAVLLQTHRLEEEGDPVQTNGSLKREEGEPSADVQLIPGADQASSSGSPEAQPKLGSENVVTVKEEVLIDGDECDECEQTDERARESRTMSFSCVVKQHRASSATHKPNIYHEAALAEAMKLDAKVAARVRLRAAGQQLHRPTKRFPHTLSSGPAAPAAPAQAVNLHQLNRVPSTSKAAPELPVPALHPGDKQTSAPNRTAASWVGLKSQHPPAAVHHGNPGPHPDPPPCGGPRHLLRCGHCGKCFPHPSNLKAHLQTHTGERPFCCLLCGRSFTKLSNLKAHRRVHTGERPYCCAACGKRFTQKCNLKRHQRIHLDI
ncbi:zinc finger and SCAN domain-containing protein 12-like [Cololabis saira]|uniref:zinc finger and SCAN domain-containing protein 12-like n=1 Tax=Cololabis saira TaxID=129043 RepID=UPI002AD49025|nr:zinc finger and SCAN domain-containing protein 12-like [Cololabis saira]